MTDAFLAYIDEAEDEEKNFCVLTVLLLPIHEFLN